MLLYLQVFKSIDLSLHILKKERKKGFWKKNWKYKRIKDIRFFFALGLNPWFIFWILGLFLESLVYFLNPWFIFWILVYFLNPWFIFLIMVYFLNPWFIFLVMVYFLNPWFIFLILGLFFESLFYFLNPWLFFWILGSSFLPFLSPSSLQATEASLDELNLDKKETEVEVSPVALMQHIFSAKKIENKPSVKHICRF